MLALRVDFFLLIFLWSPICIHWVWIWIFLIFRFLSFGICKFCHIFSYFIKFIHMSNHLSSLNTCLWFISWILLNSAHETSLVFLMPRSTKGRMSSWFLRLCRSCGFYAHSGSLGKCAERIQITFLLECPGSAATTFPWIDLRGPWQILIFIESEFIVAVEMYDQRLILRSYHILNVFLCNNLWLTWTVFVAYALKIFFRKIFFHLHYF